MARITILDGDHRDDSPLQRSITALVAQLEALGHTAQVLPLRSMKLARCTGCWSCWFATPGECSIHDDIGRVHAAWLHSDLVVLASPLQAGFVSSILKTVVDRFIPMAHPYIELVHGEMMHQHRYDRLTPMGSLIEPGPRDDTEQLGVVQAWVERTAHHCREPVGLHATADEDTEVVAQRIQAFLDGGPDAARWEPIVYPEPLPMPEIPARSGPLDLLIVHGSLRAQSNTALLMERLTQAFEATPGNRVRTVKLNNSTARQRALEAFDQADLVLFAMPLYVHAMPGTVQAFFEQIEDLEPRPGRRVGFFVQQGFHESHHSRWLERHLARLPARWGAEHLGVAIRGAVEGIQVQPAWMTRKVYAHVEALGACLGQGGRFDPAVVRAMATTEHMGFWMRGMMRAMVATGFTNLHWNMKLKENDAFARRFARPLDESELGAS